MRRHVFLLCAVLVSAQILAAKGCDVPCNRMGNSACSVKTGSFVYSNVDCASKCTTEDITELQECAFLRFYSWKRGCLVSADLPGWGGICDKVTGHVVGVDRASTDCMGMSDSSRYVSCDEVQDGGSLSSEVRAMAAIPSSDGNKSARCDSKVGEGATCSTMTGRKVGSNACEARDNGYEYTMPCSALGGTSNPHDDPTACLYAQGTDVFLGKVASHVGCLSALSHCSGGHDTDDNGPNSAAQQTGLTMDNLMFTGLCEGSAACATTAWSSFSGTPECAEVLMQGTTSCSAEEAREHFSHAVDGICEPMF